MRKIAAVTVSRSDYGLLLPVLRRIQEDPKLNLALIVAGMHLAPEFGMTVQMIENDGLEIAERVEMTLSSDTPEGVSKSMGLGMIGFSSAYARLRPDLLVVLGDRFEMHAAAAAALPFNIPVAHIHGGELTEGAIDEQLRHSITKMSHLHFASTELYSRRIRQMGEPADRVFWVGSPGIDNIRCTERYSEREFEQVYGIAVDHPCLLVTYHPVTLEYEQTEYQVDQLLDALNRLGVEAVFTYPNADTMGRYIIKRIEQFRQDSDGRVYVMPNLGSKGYLSLMGLVDAMVGNSSSGIIEAASFGLPVVNIGNRQKGRERERNVIDVGYDTDEILAGVNRALEPSFRRELVGMSNPYGDGRAAEQIVDVLKAVNLEPLRFKVFRDLEFGG